jgi:hypothetical protein
MEVIRTDSELSESSVGSWQTYVFIEHVKLDKLMFHSFVAGAGKTILWYGDIAISLP